MARMKQQQREMAERKNTECHDCHSRNLEETYYAHDGSIEGYQCRDCQNWQEKVVPVLGKYCTRCGSIALRKMFDPANRWNLTKCMECQWMEYPERSRGSGPLKGDV